MWRAIECDSDSSSIFSKVSSFQFNLEYKYILPVISELNKKINTVATSVTKSFSTDLLACQDEIKELHRLLNEERQSHREDLSVFQKKTEEFNDLLRFERNSHKDQLASAQEQMNELQGLLKKERQEHKLALDAISKTEKLFYTEQEKLKKVNQLLAEQKEIVDSSTVEEQINELQGLLNKERQEHKLALDAITKTEQLFYKEQKQLKAVSELLEEQKRINDSYNVENFERKNETLEGTNNLLTDKHNELVAKYSDLEKLYRETYDGLVHAQKLFYNEQSEHQATKEQLDKAIKKN